MIIKRDKYFQKITNVLSLGKSIFFVWARQVWKTTLMKNFLDVNKIDYFYINFDEIFWIWTKWFDTLQDFVNFLNLYYKTDILKYDFIVFDEVARVKNFNIILKALIDRYKQKTFFCSSSGNYDWVDSILEGLAWRLIKIEVFPLDFEEFLYFKWISNFKNLQITKNTFSILESYLEEYLTFGWYPEVVLTDDVYWKIKILQSISNSILQKDIINFVKAEKIFDLKRLIIYLRENIWSLFSYEKLASTLGLKYHDVKLFLDVLEKSYLIFTLSTFWTDGKIEITSKKKVYINDFWLFNSFLQRFDSDFIIEWKYVEQFVFSQLRFNIDDLQNLYFYRKRNESEIDFVLQSNWKLIPIEVKTSDKDNIPKIFESFCKKYSEKIKFFVKTSKTLQKQRNLWDCIVKILPYIKIVEVLED